MSALQRLSARCKSTPVEAFRTAHGEDRLSNHNADAFLRPSGPIYRVAQ